MRKLAGLGLLALLACDGEDPFACRLDLAGSWKERVVTFSQDCGRQYVEERTVSLESCIMTGLVSDQCQGRVKLNCPRSRLEGDLTIYSEDRWQVEGLLTDFAGCVSNSTVVYSKPKE